MATIILSRACFRSFPWRRRVHTRFGSHPVAFKARAQSTSTTPSSRHLRPEPQALDEGDRELSEEEEFAALSESSTTPFFHPDYLSSLTQHVEEEDSQMLKMQDIRDKKANTAPSLAQKTKPAAAGLAEMELWKKNILSVPAAYLRDACKCVRCVDPHSKQKNFQTTDIPTNIAISTVRRLEDGSRLICWKNDIPGLGSERLGEHTTTLSSNFFVKDEPPLRRSVPILWNRWVLEENIQYVMYEDLIDSASIVSETRLFRVLEALYQWGIVIIRGVPKGDDVSGSTFTSSVEKIAKSIGPIRDSFYGRTWDVKSVPEARNVAYTSKYLGLHMDLLYMADPPGLQLLHCIKNTADGGESIFSDSFHAACKLPISDYELLTQTSIPYRYENAGENYQHSHRVIEINGPQRGGYRTRFIRHVNYSPPFQDVFPLPGANYSRFLKALKSFAGHVEAEKNIYEYKLQEGECVIFDNRRVLHGRRQFSMMGGERWLKGAYVDTDAFKSRWRVLQEKAKSWKSPEMPRRNFVQSKTPQKVPKGIAWL